MTATAYDRSTGPRDRSLRVGDSEREAVGAVLRRRHVEGRIDVDELQSRLELSLAAKTYADLDRLVADLPSDGTDRGRRRPPVPFVLVPPAAIAAFAVVGHVFWPAIALLVLVVFRRLSRLPHVPR
jgi:hypothetical protein